MKKLLQFMLVSGRFAFPNIQMDGWLNNSSAENMKQPRDFIDAEVVILSPEEGGRSVPLSAVAYQGCYRPHIVLQSREIRQAKVEVQDGQRHVVDEYLGVAFWSGPDPIPISKPFTVTMLLMYVQHPAYDRIVPSAEFTIREGAKVVGYGRVLKRATEANAEPGAASKGGPAMAGENSEAAEGAAPPAN